MQDQVETPVRRRRWLLALAAVAGAAALGAGALLAANRTAPQPADETVELRLPDGGGDVMASCLPFTVEYLAELSTAFAGTVTDVSGDRAVLGVDRWYAGGSAPQVSVTVPDGAHIALIGTIEFREGARYLITAEDGQVNLCGFSGEATPEMEAAFEAAF
jgi:hypothetical protein